MLARLLGRRPPVASVRRLAQQLQQQQARAMSKTRAVNVVLLEDLAVRGFAGEEVQVKPGFARNFLIPNHKAVYATPENKDRFIVQRSADELALMDEKRDFVLFKERAARKPLAFARKVALDNTTLEQPLTKAELAAAVRKHLKRRVEEADLRLPRGATIKTVGEATVRVELPLPQLVLQEQQQAGAKAKTTETVELKVVVFKDEAKRDRRVGAGAGDAEGGGATGGP